MARTTPSPAITPDRSLAKASAECQRERKPNCIGKHLRKMDVEAILCARSRIAENIKPSFM